MNELSGFGKFITGEYDGTDFMQSSAVNYAATKIPAVAVLMVAVYMGHTDPVPVP